MASSVIHQQLAVSCKNSCSAKGYHGNHKMVAVSMVITAGSLAKGQILWKVRWCQILSCMNLILKSGLISKGQLII